jgi:hypothetical protein
VELARSTITLSSTEITSSVRGVVLQLKELDDRWENLLHATPMNIINLTTHIREHFQTSFTMARRAAEVAIERFDGDPELGYWWVHASQLAVLVKGDRSAWNDLWARNRVAKQPKKELDGRVLFDQTPPFISAPDFDHHNEERVCINGLLYLRADII